MLRKRLLIEMQIVSLPFRGFVASRFTSLTFRKFTRKAIVFFFLYKDKRRGCVYSISENSVSRKAKTRKGRKELGGREGGRRRKRWKCKENMAGGCGGKTKNPNRRPQKKNARHVLRVVGLFFLQHSSYFCTSHFSSPLSPSSLSHCPHSEDRSVL